MNQDDKQTSSLKSGCIVFAVLFVFIGMCNSESPTLPETPLEASGRYDHVQEIDLGRQSTLYVRSALELFTWEQATAEDLVEEGERTHQQFSGTHDGIITIQTATSESSMPSESDVYRADRTLGVFKFGERDEENQQVIWKWVDGPMVDSSIRSQEFGSNLLTIRESELWLVRVMNNDELKPYLLKERFAE